MPLRKRMIPSVQIIDGRAVKTIKFSSAVYVGDPVNAVAIFNESEVDELLVLDIGASAGKYGIDTELLAAIANNAFMPLTYGGGVASVDDAKQVVSLGYEKICISASSRATGMRNTLLEDVATELGQQAVVAAVDVSWSNGGVCLWPSRHLLTSEQFVSELSLLTSSGVGELLLSSTERDGTGLGPDKRLVDLVSGIVNVPIIYRGGLSSFEEAAGLLNASELNGVVLGRQCSFHQFPRGVLVHFPPREQVREML